MMWCGHTSCARECQCMDIIIESDLQRYITRDYGEHYRDVEVMKYYQV